MNFKLKLQSTLLLTAIATLNFFGCSHGPAIQEFPETANAREEVSRLESDFNTALTGQVNVLSPHNFKEAEEALKDAKRSLDNQSDAKDTLHEVAEGRAYLNRANEFAKLSHANLEDVIIARREAIEAGAPKFLPETFKETDELLTDATSDIEKNKLETAMENRSAMQLKYLNLELRSIKETRLGAARETIAKALKEGAKDYAPRTLAIAEKSVQDTDAFITANRHDAQVATRSDETRKSAEHLLKITRDSKSDKKVSSEDLALRMESEQNKVADKEVQLSEKESEIAGKEHQVARGQQAIQELESEKALNARFEEARALFTKSEAEVYKQGNTLMIRLRGLEFPVAQAVIKGSNFPLLAKVQKVIKDFGKSSVVVEGHTDSQGGKTFNEKLSADRAQAVKDYLVSNNDVHVSEIRAVGYGYEKPLGTNKTLSGRAQNRRVDVLIQPETSKLTDSI